MHTALPGSEAGAVVNKVLTSNRRFQIRLVRRQVHGFFLKRFMKILGAKNALHTTFNTLAIHLNQENTQKTRFLPPAALRVFLLKNFFFKNTELFHKIKIGKY